MSVNPNDFSALLSDPVLGPLVESVAKYLNKTPEEVAADIERRKEAKRRRVEANNRRYEERLNSLPEIQEVVKEKCERDGYSVDHLVINRVSGNTAVLLVKRGVWIARTGKIGNKLRVVYPDGSVSETDEKSISVKKSF